MPDLLSRLCGGDLGMSRKSKAFLMCSVSCRGVRQASSLPVLSLERALCQWQGWAGEGGKLWGELWTLCGAAAGQHRALNQLQTSWLHSAVGCSQVMLDLMQVPLAGDQHTPLLRGAQSTPAAAQPEKGVHEALCLGPPVLGGQGWCIAMCSSNAECRC